MYQGVYLFSAGQADAAEAALAEAMGYARRFRITVPEWQSAVSLANLYMMRGRLDEARTLAEDIPPGQRVRERLLTDLAQLTEAEAPPPPPLESVEGWELLVHLLHALRARWFALRHEDELARQELDDYPERFHSPAQPSWATGLRGFITGKTGGQSSASARPSI